MVGIRSTESCTTRWREIYLVMHDQTPTLRDTMFLGILCIDKVRISEIGSTLKLQLKTSKFAQTRNELSIGMTRLDQHGITTRRLALFKRYMFRCWSLTTSGLGVTNMARSCKCTWARLHPSNTSYHMGLVHHNTLDLHQASKFNCKSEKHGIGNGA